MSFSANCEGVPLHSATNKLSLQPKEKRRTIRVNLPNDLIFHCRQQIVLAFSQVSGSAPAIAFSRTLGFRYDHLIKRIG